MRGSGRQNTCMEGVNKLLNLLGMELSAVEGIFLGLNVCDEGETNSVIVGRQNIEEVNEFRNVVEVLQSQCIWIGVNVDILGDTNFLQVVRHSLKQLALICC